MKWAMLAVVLVTLLGGCICVMPASQTPAVADKRDSTEVLYLQNFLVAPNAAGDVPFTVDHWYFHAGAQAQTPPAHSPPTGSGMPGAGLSAGATDVAPEGLQTHASRSGTLDSRTWYYAGTDANYLGNGICWTNEFPIDLTQTTLTSITWYHRNTIDRSVGDGSAVGDERVVLHINGQWYLAPNTDIVSGPGAGSNGQWWLDTFTFTPKGWQKFDFVPDSHLDQTITASTNGEFTLPSGIVDAFGLYQIVPRAALVRFDTFTINGKRKQ